MILSSLISRVEEGEGADESVSCQFCGETDFDGYGLKLHLTRGWCRVFEALGPDSPSISAFQALEDSKAARADATNGDRP